MSDPIEPETGIGDGSQPYQGWPAELQKPKESGKKRKKKTAGLDPATPLNINSLMDVVTIILVYLIKSYATSPIDVKDPAIKLPTSTSPENVEEAAVVMVTGPVKEEFDHATRQPKFVANTPVLIVDGQPLFPLTAVQGADGNASYRVPAAQKEGSSDASFVITSLKTELEKAKATQEAVSALSDREFSGKVVILADKETPYRVLMDLLVTCGQAGFGEFKFAIIKDEG